ncbi:hypothetical protein [Rhodopila sp.]|uniref:hypothetical protein n=1 Tax=Rhodopila sp. TaxID=2480087 RepID=UPI003D112E59
MLQEVAVAAISQAARDHRRRIIEHQQQAEAQRKPTAAPPDPQLEIPLIGEVRSAAKPAAKPARARSKKPAQLKLTDNL